MVSVVSLDFSGTIARKGASRHLKFVVIPALLSEREGISFNKALEKVLKICSEKPAEIHWNLDFWAELVGMNPKELVCAAISEAPPLFMDPSVIELLEAEVEFIVVSRADQRFVEACLDFLGIKDSFSEIISTVTDLGMDKTGEAFEKITEMLGISPEEILHVGDNPKTDFEAPRAAGWNALLFAPFGFTLPHVKRLSEVRKFL